MSADPDVVGSESVGLHARWQLPSEALDGGVGVSAPPRHILKVRFTVSFRVWPCRLTRIIREYASHALPTLGKHPLRPHSTSRAPLVSRRAGPDKYPAPRSPQR